ncbi:copper ion binding protein [Jeotgalicoccus halotolerans]|uniref:Copper chaperone CopZ n=1 Tax=Jeotgalicoccus halotolerans TaxID=157227 RepID=A0A3E0ASJ8_9STAP|nr:copper ion binding protein [Jeotgalicoccus halotolerans]REG22691.1 copper chaperone [Jeotgalicoccus halotolerans]
MSKVILNVEGMSCGACVNKVEESVGQLNGVESVKVQLPAGKADVTFNDSTINLDDIKVVIQNTGYEIKENADKEDGSACSCCG